MTARRRAHHTAGASAQYRVQYDDAETCVVLMHTAESGTFGALRRHYRAFARLTQEELADRAGITEDGVQDRERGLRSQDPEVLQRLAAALELGDVVGLVNDADRGDSDSLPTYKSIRTNAIRQ